MKRVLLICTIVICLGLPAYSSEITLMMSLGNSEFSWEREPDDSGIPHDDFFFSFLLEGNRFFDRTFGMTYAIGRDPVLRHSGEFRFTHSQERIAFSVGPYFGLSNAIERLISPGVAASLRLEAWNIGHLFLETYRPFLPEPRKNGEYLQSQDQASFRFYIPNILTGLNWHRKQFSEFRDDYLASYSITNYSLTTDIHAKNVPYRVLLTFGYQDRELEFTESDDDQTHSVGSLILGTRLSFQISQEMLFVMDLDSAIYSFGRDELLGKTVQDRYIFGFGTGVVISVGSE